MVDQDRPTARTPVSTATLFLYWVLKASFLGRFDLISICSANFHGLLYQSEWKAKWSFSALLYFHFRLLFSLLNWKHCDWKWMQSLLEIRRATVTLPVSYHGHFLFSISWKNSVIRDYKNNFGTNYLLTQITWFKYRPDVCFRSFQRRQKRVSNYAPVVIICQGQDTHISSPAVEQPLYNCTTMWNLTGVRFSLVADMHCPSPMESGVLG